MDTILELIKQSGGRLTKTRQAIIRLLTGSECLLSGADILAGLKKLKLSPDRTTIFRELNYLTKLGIVVKSSINGKDCYEIQDEHDHHHHLICLNCKDIQKVELNSHLESQERQIKKQTNFRITGHALEFYGYCIKCKAASGK